MLAPLTNTQSNPDGTLSDLEYRWLAMRAIGGFGLTMTCASHVQEVGQGFPGQLGIFDDRHVEGLGRLATALNDAGTVSYVQLHHAGIRAAASVTGLQPVGPSDHGPTGSRALTADEIEGVVEGFASAARRAQDAGFHGVEVHGAHGYLLCQFLSAEHNLRTDQYGGSLENRARLLREVIAAIRAACGERLAISVRLSPERFGLRIDEMLDVYRMLVSDGVVDLLDLSLFDVDKQPEDPAFAGRSLTEIFSTEPRGTARLGVAGKLHDPADAQRVVDCGVDVAVLGKVGILHHDYPARALADPSWMPRHPPVTVDELEREGVSPKFVDYLRAGWSGFVSD